MNEIEKSGFFSPSLGVRYKSGARLVQDSLKLGGGFAALTCSKIGSPYTYTASNSFSRENPNRLSGSDQAVARARAFLGRNKTSVADMNNGTPAMARPT